jgi:hypothetical protein
LTALSIPERFALLGDFEPAVFMAPWFSAELVATPAALGHVRAWVTAGQPVADVEALMVLGDGPVAEAALAVVRVLPPPMKHLAVSKVAIVGIGAESAGECHAMPEGRTCLVAISAARRGLDDLRSLVAHELSHAWLHPPSPRRPSSPADRRALHALTERVYAAAARGECDEWTLAGLHVEQEAVALTRALGFTTGPGSRLSDSLARVADTVQRAQHQED